jgi:hypothetical protein
VTGSISRKLYQQFLLLYPEPFRHEFGDEMLDIFEEYRGIQGSLRLLADAVLSAAKQQLHYLATPAPRSAPLFWEIASSPNLARMLALAVFGASLMAGVLAGGKPETPEFWTLVRPKAVFWFPTVAWGRYCSDAPERMGKPESVLVAGVLVGRKSEDPESWTVVRVACKQYVPTRVSLGGNQRASLLRMPVGDIGRGGATSERRRN